MEGRWAAEDYYIKGGDIIIGRWFCVLGVIAREREQWRLIIASDYLTISSVYIIVRGVVGKKKRGRGLVSCL